MINRRQLVLVFMAVAASGCDGLIQVDQKTRLRAVRISLSPDRINLLYASLDTFARQHRFTFSIDDYRSLRGGISHNFQLRRSDLWIVGSNPPSDNLDIEHLPDGTTRASAGIEEGIFEVAFSPWRTQPTEGELNYVVSQFIAAALAVEGATAVEIPDEGLPAQ